MPRPKPESLSADAVKKANETLAIIAPHVPKNGMSNIIKAEAVINYALECAKDFKYKVDLDAAAKRGDVVALIEELKAGLKAQQTKGEAAE